MVSSATSSLPLGHFICGDLSRQSVEEAASLAGVMLLTHSCFGIRLSLAFLLVVMSLGFFIISRAEDYEMPTKQDRGFGCRFLALLFGRYFAQISCRRFLHNALPTMQV